MKIASSSICIYTNSNIICGKNINGGIKWEKNV